MSRQSRARRSRGLRGEAAALRSRGLASCRGKAARGEAAYNLVIIIIIIIIIKQENNEWRIVKD